MLHFEGDKEFPQTPTDLWARLSDASFLMECIPNREAIKLAEPEKAVFSIRPGVSFVRGLLELTLQISKAEPATLVSLLVHTKGIGTTSDVGAALKFAPREGGSHLHWTVEVQKMGGLLKAVPQGLIQASALKVIGDLWLAVEDRLAKEYREIKRAPES